MSNALLARVSEMKKVLMIVIVILVALQSSIILKKATTIWSETILQYFS